MCIRFKFPTQTLGKTQGPGAAPGMTSLGPGSSQLSRPQCAHVDAHSVEAALPPRVPSAQGRCGCLTASERGRFAYKWATKQTHKNSFSVCFGLLNCRWQIVDPYFYCCYVCGRHLTTKKKGGGEEEEKKTQLVCEMVILLSTALPEGGRRQSQWDSGKRFEYRSHKVLLFKR